MRKIILILFILIGSLSFATKEVNAGGCVGTCAKWDCGIPTCGNNGCSTDCTCSDYLVNGGDQTWCSSVNCGPGYYVSNNGCTPIGTGPGPTCFVPGTIVSSPGGDKKIEDIKVGDEVSSFANDKIVNSSVSQIYKAQRDYYFDLKAGDYQVKVTAEHPFYIGNDKFEEVQNLKVGDRVYVEENEGLVAKQVTSNTRIDEKTDVYNMSVDNTNTYGSSVKQCISNRD